jgi:hypothetical protein
LFDFQRFSHQQTEDGSDPSSKWGKDLDDSDREDPDTEDNMPIPHAGTRPTSGKTPVQDPLRNWTDDDDNDLEVLNPVPIAFKFPLNPTPADGEEQVLEVSPIAGGGGRKHIASGPTNV